MKKLIVIALLAGCATVQRVDLLPRGDAPRGTGSFDHIHQVLTVEIEGQSYRGTPIRKTAQTSASIFMAGATTRTNEDTALLIGPAGQIRCEFAWQEMKTQATGVCVDHRNRTYDLLIRNP